MPLTYYQLMGLTDYTQSEAVCENQLKRSELSIPRCRDKSSTISPDSCRGIETNVIWRWDQDIRQCWCTEMAFRPTHYTKSLTCTSLSTTVCRNEKSNGTSNSVPYINNTPLVQGIFPHSHYTISSWQIFEDDVIVVYIYITHLYSRALSLKFGTHRYIPLYCYAFQSRLFWLIFRSE